MALTGTTIRNLKPQQKHSHRDLAQRQSAVAQCQSDRLPQFTASRPRRWSRRVSHGCCR
jgi:hypothetical protein